MENSMTSTLKALAAQVASASHNVHTAAPANPTGTVRIADVRRAADDAKDTLRHRLNS